MAAPGSLQMCYGCVAWCFCATPNNVSGSISDPFDCSRGPFLLPDCLLQSRYEDRPSLIGHCFAMLG